MTNNPFLLASIIRNMLRQLFSREPEYVESRAEAQQNFQQTIVEPFKEGYNGPPAPKQVLLRKPYKIMLAILPAAIFLSIILSQR